MGVFRFVLAMTLTLLLSNQLPGFCQRAESQEPTLTIFRPKPDENFRDQPIVVEVAVENFALVPPVPRSEDPVTEPSGHLHYFLDANPLVATSSQKLMFGEEFDGNSMTAGEHKLVVELVYENHRSLTPRLMQQVRFFTGEKQNYRKPIGGDRFTGQVK